jgi:hypothetical protein
MANISVSLPADGETADASDYNTPINTIVTEFNGNIDNSNIKANAAISGSKIADDAGITTAKLADASVTGAKIDFAATGAGGVWWEELGRTTNSGQSSISVSSFPAREYLEVFLRVAPSTALEIRLTFNGDTGNNYSGRIYVTDDTTATTTNTNNIRLFASSAVHRVFRLTIMNLPGNGKQLFGNAVSASAASGAPTYARIAGYWSNTSDLITTMTVTASTGNLGAAELIVLGHN